MNGYHISASIKNYPSPPELLVDVLEMLVVYMLKVMSIE